MKRSLLILIVAAATVFSCTALSFVLYGIKSVDSGAAMNGPCIVIDAGHGGADAGTSSANGTPEKDINLAIAFDLYDFLNSSGIKCRLIRDDDSEFYREGESRERSDLYNRLDFVNSTDNAVLVSIHQNYFDDISQSGMQVWYSKNTPESKRLADLILGNTKRFLQPDNNRSNKASDDSYYILYNASVPSVMVECGFMSNPQEAELLCDESYRKSIAAVIALGITQFINEEY